MHSSHNTMPDESAISGSVLYPQERCSKRSREIGSGSWFGTTKYNVTGTPRAPQPWMFILVASNGAICCRLMLCSNQKSCQKEKCPAVVKKSKAVRSRTQRKPGATLLFSTLQRSRILFSMPEVDTRFKQKERNRQQQDDREQHADGRICATDGHASFSVSYRKYNGLGGTSNKRLLKQGRDPFESQILLTVPYGHAEHFARFGNYETLSTLAD